MPFLEPFVQEAVGQRVEIDRVQLAAQVDCEGCVGKVGRVHAQLSDVGDLDGVDGDQADGQTSHRAVHPVQQAAEPVAGQRFGKSYGRGEGEPGERVGEDGAFLFEGAEDAEQDVVDATGLVSLPVAEGGGHVSGGDLSQVQPVLAPEVQDRKNDV